MNRDEDNENVMTFLSGEEPRKKSGKSEESKHRSAGSSDSMVNYMPVISENFISQPDSRQSRGAIKKKSEEKP